MPGSAGDWRPDRSELWNTAEKANKRGDAIIAREIEVSLPHELDAAQRKALGLDFAKYVAEKYSVAVDVAFHAPNRNGDQRNFHMHLLMTAKRVKGEGFGTQALELDPYSAAYRGANKDTPNAVAVMREVWADLANNALEAAGRSERIDHRSFEAQGKDEQATVHMGVNASNMERKGQVTDLGDLNRSIVASNENRARLKVEHAAISAELIDLDAARARHEAAQKARDPAELLAAITRNRSTFTRFDVNRAATPGFPDAKERAAFTDSVLARGEIIPLRERGSDIVSRYTTRAVIETENVALEAARRMAQPSPRSGLSAGTLRDVFRDHSQLDDEQRAAVAHASGPSRFALIMGEAGTGKSTTLAAIREGYEAEGFHVVGLSHTNKVVQGMSADGFDNVATVTAELGRLEKGRGKPWDARTVVIVDEMAQLSTAQLAALFRQADESGATLRGAGDYRQFASIERGGLFEVLCDEHKAAKLTAIYRVKDEDQKAAFSAMHEGDFQTGLRLLDKGGAIHWAKSPEDSKADLIRQWAADSAAEPEKRRFIIAYTNREVDELNAAARAALKEAGRLGEGVTLETKNGPANFAEGDQIILTATARTKAQRASGLYNNSTGTITEIAQGENGARVTVLLDRKDRDGTLRQVSFVVGENAERGEFNALKHGYAGTIYKTQGDNIPVPYVLHSDQWRSAGGYVALTRQSERVAMFAAEKPTAWMRAEGGLAALTDAQRESAEQSYAAWAEAKPRLAEKYDLANYIGYVQDQWRDQKDLDRLDRMARQMSRVEETRAASAFEQGFAPRPQEPTEPAAPPPERARGMGGRYDELNALTEKAKDAPPPAARPLEPAKSDPPASEPEKPAARPMTAEERFEALQAKAEAALTKRKDDTKPQDIMEFIRERSRERGPSR
jgi:Ti-type conjugative transfer relaxase TraA